MYFLNTIKRSLRKPGTCQFIIIFINYWKDRYRLNNSRLGRALVSFKRIYQVMVMLFYIKLLGKNITCIPCTRFWLFDG